MQRCGEQKLPKHIKKQYGVAPEVVSKKYLCIVLILPTGCEPFQRPTADNGVDCSRTDLLWRSSSPAPSNRRSTSRRIASDRRNLRWDASHGSPRGKIHRAARPGHSIASTRKNSMLKTRITEQYGLKVPFINAGMAFIATAPLVRSVCKAGGMGMLGATAIAPRTSCKRRSATSKQQTPDASGSISLHGSAASIRSRSASQKRRRLSCSFGMTRRTSGFHACGRPAATSGFKLAAWTKRKPLGFPPTPEFTGDLEEMSLLAGESVGQTNRLMSAASIIDEMMNGAEAVIRKRLGSMVVD